jgi:hypothetical protein
MGGPVRAKVLGGDTYNDSDRVQLSDAAQKAADRSSSTDRGSSPAQVSPTGSRIDVWA